MIGGGLGLLALLGGLTQSGIYNPAMAIALGIQGMDGSAIAIVDEFLAVGLLLLLLPQRPQSAD